MSEDSDFPPPEPEPTRALMLSEALDACIEAEREVPGSADQIIAGKAAWMRGELRRLLRLTGSLEAAASSAAISEDFRVAARGRLMRRITSSAEGPDSPSAWSADKAVSDRVTTGSIVVAAPSDAAAELEPVSIAPPPPIALSAPRGRRRRARWLRRAALGAILAAVLAAALTLSASASSLPGQPLYSIKQATEDLGVRFAPDGQARTRILLWQTNMRLDETARLLDEGRTDQVATTTRRFDDALDQVTASYLVTLDASPTQTEDQTTALLEATLGQEQAQIQTMLASAPEAAQAELRQALVATERDRARVAGLEPSTIENAPSAGGHAQAAEMQRAGEVAASTTDATSPPPPVDLVAPAVDLTPMA
ncbi:MAG: hypothetical protein JO057_26895, partial [Chloroflexi bacterium]|nr:hypothetical protein [Chloroflexota bacterium]